MFNKLLQVEARTMQEALKLNARFRASAQAHRRRNKDCIDAATEAALDLIQSRFERTTKTYVSNGLVITKMKPVSKRKAI